MTPPSSRISEKQFHRLLMLGNGSMLVSGGNQRDWKTLYERGLVDGELGAQGCYINGIRVTADGHRAIADAMDRYGRPEAGRARARKRA